MIPAWLVSLSVLANTLTCGPEGYSLCARFYENKLRRFDPWWCFVVRCTDLIFWWDDQHCRKAYQLRRK